MAAKADPAIQEAVRKNGVKLKHIPKALKSAQLCLEAVKQNGWTLACMLDELKTHEVCLEAIKQYRGAFDYVPYKLKAALERFI